MVRRASEHPTELELELLKILWQRDRQSVRQVRDALARSGRDLAYTTVMTMMNIMVDKGYLRRRKRGQAFDYCHRVTAHKTRGKMLADLIRRAFGGSARLAMIHLLDEADLSDGEIQELRKLLKAKSREDAP